MSPHDSADAEDRDSDVEEHDPNSIRDELSRSLDEGNRALNRARELLARVAELGGADSGSISRSESLALYAEMLRRPTGDS